MANRVPATCQPISKPLVHINSYDLQTSTMCYYWYRYYSIVQMRKLRQRAINNLPKASTGSRAKNPFEQTDVLITPMPAAFQLSHH